MYSTESSCVILLRTIKLSMGGPAAVDEACRILTEKAVAVGETSVRAARGNLARDHRRSQQAGMTMGRRFYLT